MGPPRYVLTEQTGYACCTFRIRTKRSPSRNTPGFTGAPTVRPTIATRFQLSMYIDHYHQELDQRLYGGTKCSETITELYVPLPELAVFMDAAAEELKQRCANVIYGTVRLIAQDDETFLNWARQPYACVVFNLHFEHTEQGIAKVTDDLRCLIDLAAVLGGSYFLTYNRFARPDQLTRCYPQFDEFLHLKGPVRPGRGVLQRLAPSLPLLGVRPQDCPLASARPNGYDWRSESVPRRKADGYRFH